MKKHRRALKIGIIVLCAVFLAFAALHSTPKAAIRTYLFTRSVPYIFKYHSLDMSQPMFDTLGPKVQFQKLNPDVVGQDNRYPKPKEIYPGAKGLFYGVSVRGYIGDVDYFEIKKVGILYFANLLRLYN